MSSFSDWFSRASFAGNSKRRSGKHASRNRRRCFGIERLEPRQMLALTAIHNPDNSWTVEPEQMRGLPGGGTGPDPNYYFVDLIFHEGSNNVTCDWVDLTQYFGPMNDPARGTLQLDNTSLGHEPDIDVLLNDPGMLQPTAPMGALPFSNQVEMEDRTDRTAFPHTLGSGQDETFLLNEWNDPFLGQLGPSIEFDTNTTTPDAALPTPNMMVLWENSGNPLLAGSIGANSSGTTQSLSVFDSTFQNNPIQVTTGGDRFLVAATDPLTDTTLGGGGFIYPGHFLPPVPGPNFIGDEFDVSSDVVTNEGPTFSGNLNGIQGPLAIAAEAGPNTVIISDQGNTTLANAYDVQISSTVVNPINNQIVETIDGFAPQPITLENVVPADPFNPPRTISSISVTLVGADAEPLTLPPAGSPLATYTISGTLELTNVVGHPTWINTLTIDGGASGLNEFDILNPAAGNAPVAENVIAISTGDGDFNTVNIASDAPANTGDMTGITSAIVINGGTGVDNTVNMVDMTDPNGVKAIAVDVTGAGGLDQLQNGVVYTQITGFTPASISLSQALGGVLSANVFGSSMQPLDFNLRSDSISAITVTTGDVDQNHVVLGSTAPLFTGTVDNILSAVTVNFGGGQLNTFIVADQSGRLPVGALLENDATGTYNQITGYTSPLIQYSAATGSHLDVLMYAANNVPTTFTVGSTLGTGTTLSLNGGTTGSDEFDVQGAAADNVTINTGNGKNNAVNISSDAPTNTGDLANIGATTQITVNAGSGTDLLAVSDIGGSDTPTVTLTSTQIAGLTPLPILYTKIPGGGLAVHLYGTDAQPTTFNVPNTLVAAGNTVLLVGGAAGGNAFNIGSTQADNNGQLNKIGSAITVDGGPGTDNNLEINDHGSSGAFNYIIGANSLTNDVKTTVRPFRGVSYTNVQTMTLDATEQANQFVVNPSPTAVYNINGYGPTGTAAKPVPAGKGDSLSVDFSGVKGPVLNKNPETPGSNSFDGSWTFSNRAEIDFQNIEQFPLSIVAYGADASASGQPLVKVLYANSDALVNPALPQGFLAFEPSYHGGVRVAIGYFDNSGLQEIAVAPGTGHAPIVKVFDIYGNFKYQFTAYASSVNGGLNIAAGNIEGLTNGGNELDDIVTVPSHGVSEVRVWHDQATTVPAVPFTLYRDFTVWSKTFVGGSTVAVADLKGTGRAAVIVGSGPGMAPLIEAFDVTPKASAYFPFRVIAPFTSTFRGGVNVSAISAGSGVPTPLIIASQGNSGAPTVQVFNGLTGALSSFVVPYAGTGSNAPVRTVPKVIGGHLYIYTAQQVHGQSDTIRKYDPSTGAIVDYIIETDPNFSGIFLG